MKETTSLHLKQQIINEAVSVGMDLSGFAGMTDLETWNAYMRLAVEQAFMDRLPELQKTAENLEKTNVLHGLWMRKLVLEKRLIREYPAGGELIKNLAGYIQCVDMHRRTEVSGSSTFIWFGSALLSDYDQRNS